MAVETVEYRVRRGDTLQNIIQRAGFPRRDWRRIYDAPYNRGIRSQRPDPDHIQPGDRLMLPRFNARQLADIVQRIQMVERRLSLMNTAVTEFEREIAQLEREIRDARQLSERDLERRVNALLRRATALDDLADAAADECSDMYSCMGAGAATARFQLEARRVRNEAGQLQRSFKKGEQAAIKALKKLTARLQVFSRAQSSTASDVSRLRALYRRAAQNPY